MKCEYQIVLELLNCAIHEKKYESKIEITGNIWKEVWDILSQNGLAGVVFRTVQELDEKNRPNEELLNKWKKYSFSCGMRQIIQNKNVYAVIDDAKKAGITLIVIKGNALALLYPEPNMRISCDSDLYVDISHKDEAISVIVNNGYKYKQEGSKENVPVFIKDKGGKIELHNRLWEDYQSELTDVLDSFNLTDENKCIKISDGKNEFLTLGYTEHLIFQIFHIVKHFSLEGIGLKYICDISLYAEKYINNINWDDFWQKMKVLHYDIFCDALFKIAVKYMGLDKNILREEYKDKVVNDELIEDIIRIGKVNDEDVVSWNAMGKLLPYFLQEKKAPVSKWEKFRNKFFPTQNDLSDYYEYAKKNKLLLPIAWGHRFFHSRKYEAEHKITQEDKRKKNDKYEHRITLLNEAGLNDR